MLKIGHRGAKGHRAENTLASFQKAINLGCDGIEFDVQTCKTGEIVVIHDATIDRTTAGTGFVKDLRLSELKKYGIVTFEEVLDLVNNQFLVNIELKSDVCVEKVIKIINYYIQEKQWNFENFLISSFNWDDLLKVSASHNKLRIGILTENNIEKAFEFAKKSTAFAINPYFKLVTAKNVSMLHQNSFKIIVWTVNEPVDIIKMKALKIDGIISDFPDRL